MSEAELGVLVFDKLSVGMTSIPARLPQVWAYLTKCISTFCNVNAVDLSDAISLYEGYCSLAGAKSEPCNGERHPLKHSDSGDEHAVCITWKSPCRTCHQHRYIRGPANSINQLSEWPLKMPVVVGLAVAAFSAAHLLLV